MNRRLLETFAVVYRLISDQLHWCALRHRFLNTHYAQNVNEKLCVPLRFPSASSALKKTKLAIAFAGAH